MFESISPKKPHSKTLLLLGLFLFIMAQGAFCQTASAQRLMDRLRARVQSRYAPPTPPTQPLPYRYPVSPTQQPPGAERRAGASAPTAEPAISPQFGIEVTLSSEGRYRGLKVLGFSPDSRAPAIGLRPGDLIVSINGMRTDSLDAGAEAQRKLAAGQSSMIQVVRNGRLYRAQLPGMDSTPSGPTAPAAGATASSTPPTRAAAKPPMSNSPSGPTLAKPRSSLGIQVVDATPQRGVLVATVKEGSAGQVAGFQPHDRIVSAAGRLIRDTSDLIRELALSNPGDSTKFGIVRDNAPQEIDVEMGGPDGAAVRAAVDDRKPTQPQRSQSPQRSKNSNSLLPAPRPTPDNQPHEVQSGRAQPESAQSLRGAIREHESSLPVPASEAPSSTADPLALPEDDDSMELLPAPKS